MCRMVAIGGLQSIHCPECESQQIVKNGKITIQDGTIVQKHLCKNCRKQFNERTGTPMACLRTPSTLVTLAMAVCSEGIGVRATGSSFGKSRSTILCWKNHLFKQASHWLSRSLKPLFCKGLRRRAIMIFNPSLRTLIPSRYN
ncbi:transposase [Stenomitos frigidus]|uniref:transposase n=1 Tax=Stenomitos frigidus TaxID=1886765 RepID=UPI003D64EB57